MNEKWSHYPRPDEIKNISKKDVVIPGSICQLYFLTSLMRNTCHFKGKREIRMLLSVKKFNILLSTMFTQCYPENKFNDSTQKRRKYGVSALK